MNGPGENENLELQIRRLGDFLYGVPRPDARLNIQEIFAGLPDIGPSLDHLLTEFENRGVIRTSFKRDAIQLVPRGKRLHEADCFPEVILGVQYIRRKYSRAVVHIIVRSLNGDEHGGTGFFVAEPENAILTAKHVVEGNEILRIEHEDHHVLAAGNPQVLAAEGNLDLAILQCEKPNEIHPFKIEWDDQEVNPFDPVLVFGYPRIPGHDVALHHSTGEISSIPHAYDDDRVSLIISSSAPPGCSGGPVVNLSGLAVGVVKEEIFDQHLGQPRMVVFISATPANYVRGLS